MKFKDGVSLEGVRSEILKIIPGVERFFKQAGIELTITCATGSHGEVDPHTWGFAIDCRVHGLSVDWQHSLKHALSNYLGPQYYVKLEDPGKKNEHIHIQYRIDLWRKIVRAEGHLEIPEA